MDHEMIARGCPWRILSRFDWVCKALLDQPHGCFCCAENCAPLHIADLLINDRREEKIGGKNENHTGAEAAARGDEG